MPILIDETTQNVKHSDETLSFSSKEKDKITFGKKQSFFPNETLSNETIVNNKNPMTCEYFI